jgi:hypothetical protein
MLSVTDNQRFQDILHRLAQYGTLDDPEVAANLSTGLNAFLSRWKDEVLPFVAAGGAELRFIEGPNGRGKTHFLQTLEITAQREGFVTSRVECGMQHKPFASLQETYRAVAASISASTASNNGTGTGLAWLLRQLSPEQLQAFQHASRGNPRFRNLVIAYGMRAQAGQLRDQVTADLRALLEHDPSRHVTFSGLFDTARKMGVSLHRPLGRIGKRNAAVWLRSLLALPRQLGFKGLVVLFDETGADISIRSTSGNRRERQQHLANLRNLVDHLATGGTPSCSVVYATTRDLVEIARREYPALSQRIERCEQISFTKLSQRNPRAIWCWLDELTIPAPDIPDFYEELGEKLVTFASEASIPKKRLDAVRAQLPALAEKMSQDLTQAAVRKFIKLIASDILRTN